MKEMRMVFKLREIMESDEGWGRAKGRDVYQQLIKVIESNPGVLVFMISMEGVRRVDISFASETVVEIARRYRGSKGFCITNIYDPDVIENWDAAAVKREMPILIWENNSPALIGPKPSEGLREAFEFALKRAEVRASEFAEKKRGMTISNASMKFKQLWEKGFILRRNMQRQQKNKDVAQSGGIEFRYFRIG